MLYPAPYHPLERQLACVEVGCASETGTAPTMRSPRGSGDACQSLHMLLDLDGDLLCAGLVDLGEHDPAEGCDVSGFGEADMPLADAGMLGQAGDLVAAGHRVNHPNNTRPAIRGRRHAVQDVMATGTGD